MTDKGTGTDGRTDGRFDARMPLRTSTNMATQPPLRILLLVTGLRLGGAEQQVAALAGRYRALGHAVAVVSLTPGCEVTLPADAALLQLDMRKTPLSMAAALWRVRRFIRQWRPTLVHAHMVHANLFARALTRLGPTPPVICTAHSYREGGALRMAAYRVTDRWAKLNTHVGWEGRQRMVEAGVAAPDRIIVTPNGIDTTRFRPDPAMRPVHRATLGIGVREALVVNVGRLVPDKAQALLIDAFAMLPPDCNARLLIAGDGPLRETLAAQIVASGQQHRIALLGMRRDVPALLNAADLFVLSSDIEGMPLVVGEALGCGCPVVATDAPGVASMLGKDSLRRQAEPIGGFPPGGIPSADGEGAKGEMGMRGPAGEPDAEHRNAVENVKGDIDSLIVPRGDARALCAGIETMLARQPADSETMQALRRARNAGLAARLGLDSIASRWIDIYRAVAADPFAGNAGSARPRTEAA